MNTKPYVWQMVEEAVENLGGKATYSQIKDCIRNKYGDVNESTINCQINKLSHSFDCFNFFFAKWIFGFWV